MDDAIGPEIQRDATQSCHDVDRLMIGRAICASLVLHVLLLFILASTSASFTFYPAIGAFERFDFIWVTPSAEPANPGPTAAASPAQETPGQRAKPIGAVKPPPLEEIEAASDSPPRFPEPGIAPATVQRPSKVETAVSLEVVKLAPPPDKEPEKTRKRGFAGTREEARVKELPAAAPADGQQRVKEMVAERVDGKALPGEAAEKDQPIPEKDAVAPPPHLDAPIPLLSSPLKGEGRTGERLSAAPSKPASGNLSQAETPPHPGAPIPLLSSPLKGEGRVGGRSSKGEVRTGGRSSTAPSKPAGGSLPQAEAHPPLQGEGRGGDGGSRRQRDQRALVAPKPEPADAPIPSERLTGSKGLVIASPRGDLKLVMVGDSTINLSVTFRQYPKSRRNKATRSEARRVQTMVPLLTKIREDTREAVIETAQEGVYTFSAESHQETGSRATFTLRVFESGSGERITRLGARTISGTSVLVKVLMPEAVIWDDESAFTGTLEDSDSEARFNTETGLFWKEYHD